MIQVIKNIFFDISLLFRNFIHWTSSKIVIYILSFLLWLLLSLPFLIILWILVFLDPINWNDIVFNFTTTQSVWLAFLEAISTHFIYLIFEVLIAVLAISFFAFGYSYYILPLTNVYLSYQKWEKLPISQNIYFDFKSIKKYLYIVWWQSLAFLIPFLVFIIVFFVLIFSFWWVEKVFSTYQNEMFSYFSLSLWITFLILFLVFIYLAFRVSFAVILFLDKNKNPEEKSWLFYVKDSFNISSWLKIFKFLWVLIIYTIILMPFNFLFSFLWDYENWIIDFWVFLVNFLVFSWLFEMLLLSIYKNVMIWENKEEVN